MCLQTIKSLLYKVQTFFENLWIFFLEVNKSGDFDFKLRKLPPYKRINNNLGKTCSLGSDNVINMYGCRLEFGRK